MKNLMKISRRKSKTGSKKGTPCSSSNDNLVSKDDPNNNHDSLIADAKPTKDDGSCSVVAMVLGSGSFYHHNGILSTALKTLAHHGTIGSSSKSKAAQRFLRHSSSFLRVADLGLEEQTTTSSLSRQRQRPSSPLTMRTGSTATLGIDEDNSSIDSAESTVMSDGQSTDSGGVGGSGGNGLANFSYAASDPPPGVDHDPQERWIALDDGFGSHAPIAPLAVQALAKTGLDASLNEDMWTPHTSSRYFKAAPWHAYTWPSSSASNDNSCTIPNEELPQPQGKYEDMVLLWTGKFQHGLYGSELPAVRAVGIIGCPPQALFELLIDSTRVKEYNQMSLGREDLLILQDSLHEDGPFGRSVTKVMRSKSTPPLISKTMELISMLHAQELEDGSGYLIVTRAVSHPDTHSSSSTSDSSVLRSEILLGVNVIRRIDGDPNRCIMINMIHMRSPMVPMIIANRIGASAASNFIKDLQKAGKELCR